MTCSSRAASTASTTGFSLSLSGIMRALRRPSYPPWPLMKDEGQKVDGVCLKARRRWHGRHRLDGLALQLSYGRSRELTVLVVERYFDLFADLPVRRLDRRRQLVGFAIVERDHAGGRVDRFDRSGDIGRVGERNPGEQGGCTQGGKRQLAHLFTPLVSASGKRPSGPGA